VSAEFSGKLEDVFRRGRLLPARSRLVVGVSGGLDSTLLLVLLRELSERWHWVLHVAHFNHQLRGRASVDDERFVRSLARRMGLSFFRGGVAVAGEAERRKVSVEVAARDCRHSFLAGVAHQVGAKRVVLAHHADDQAELLLIRLLRGSGVSGLGGMRWQSASPVDKKVRLVRPLLGFSRAELEGEARGRHLRWREDASNNELEPLRNRVRLLLMPRFREVAQGEVLGVLGRTMEVLRDESDFIAGELGLWRERVRELGWGRVPTAIQRRLVVEQLIRAEVAPEFDLVERLRLEPGKIWSVGVDRGVVLESSGELVLKRNQKVAFRADRQRFVLTGSRGRLDLGPRSVRWRVEATAGGGDWRSYVRSGREVFDADRVGEGVVLRYWVPGDRFAPIGLGASARLQDLFVSAKVPARLRRSMLVAQSDGGVIFWVEGLRIGEWGRVTQSTRRLLIWEPDLSPSGGC
jgi:tRNA(Ile)-lysidine synthase